MWLKCDSSAAAPRTLTSRSERTCSVLGHTVQNNVNTSQSVSCKDFYGCSCAWASGGSPIESRACACVNTQPRDMSLDHALMEVSSNQHAKGISKAYRQVMRLWAMGHHCSPWACRASAASLALAASRASVACRAWEASRPSGDLPPKKACPT